MTAETELAGRAQPADCPDFRSLFEAAPDCYLVLAPDRSIVAVSEAYLRVTSTRRAELVGRPLLDVLRDQSGVPVTNAMRDLQASLDRVSAHRVPDTMVSQKYDVPRSAEAGGGFETHYWSAVNSPVLDASNELRYIIHRIEDVTEFVHAQQLERQADIERRHLAAIVAFSDDAIISKTLDGVITSWNPAAVRLFGYAASEAIGQPMMLVIPADRADEEPRILAMLARGERTDHFETVRVRKDGKRIDVAVTVSPIRDASGTIVGASKIARDITGIKAAEATLASKNREMEVAARLARVDRIGARVMVAFNERSQDTTPGAEVLHILAEEAGYRPLAFYEYDEWQGSLVLGAGLSLAPGYEASKFRIGEGLVGEAAASRVPRFIDASPSTAYTLDTGVGVLEPATIFALPLVYREKLLGVIAGAAREKLPERDRPWLAQVAGQVAIGLHALRQFQELKDLSQQLNERSRKIEAQNQQLAEASRLKSEFLASMSHELRTPLNAIIGFSEVLKDGVLGELPPDQLDYISEVYKSGHHLLSLINDILDLSKIEAGKMELDLETVELEPVIANAFTILKERAIKGKVTLSRATAPELVSIVADGRKFRQVAYNLLSNAVKFTPPGGTVRLELTLHGPDVELAVRDSGIGIAQADLARLFRPFVQLEGGLERRFEGTGLGLVMVKNLVELHGGTFGVESELGRGSRFWVRLPRAPTGTPAPEPGVSTVVRSVASSSGAVPRILVVDDDPVAISLARRWLERAGYVVEGAQTCDVAWAEIQRNPPDAILLDILFDNRPSGWEFLTQLKDAADVANIPVVIISIVADLKRGLALGAVGVLQKPIAGAELLRAVEALRIVPCRDGQAPEILVVDDDPGAVEHIAKPLERHGVVVTRAYGGREALAAVTSGKPDALVLDLIMPEVSGLDVLRELRANPATAELPIIVVTAKVLEPAERATLEGLVHAVLAKGDWDDRKFIQVIRRAIHARSPREAEPMTVAPERARDMPAARGAKHQSRILVIDDEAATRDLLRLYLEDAGFAVTAAASVDEAIALLDGMRPDLITLDLAMPGMDGLEFLSIHGQRDDLWGVPVLVVSSADRPERALALGAEAVLAKPLHRNELLKVVASLLENTGDRRSYVLVTDDDPAAARIVTSHLENEALEVACAYGGQEALESIAARRPDLLILDLVMPDLSGFDVLAHLRAAPATVDLPIIILTAKEVSAADRAVLAQTVQVMFAKGIVERGDLRERCAG